MEKGSFKFISIQAPDDATWRRAARSHAAKQAIEKKRRREEEAGDNFRVVAIPTCRTLLRRAKQPTNKKKKMMTLFSGLSAGVMDPFASLAVQPSRMQSLLCNRKARLAPEPVFSMAEGLAFQSVEAVFRTGLVDPALVNAVMFSLVFATTEGQVIDRECLGYQGRAIGHIRQRMGSPDEATSESTIGAILLLAGVEARLGMTSQVQMHMGAVKLLLEICRAKSVYLTGGIKRAIFWQDLNSSILAGSSRIVDHTTFAELDWRRDAFSPHFYRLPPGFQEPRFQALTEAFVEVLEDIHALQCIRDYPTFTNRDTMMMAYINNHTASMQSRLMGLANLSPALECCRLAAYLCSVMLCCTVWCALVIPSHVSTQLLRQLQQANDDAAWDEHREFLVWLLYIGGAFSPAGPIRREYVVLLRSNHAARFGNLYTSWSELLEILRRFIWSEKAFTAHVRGLWEELNLGGLHE